MSDRAVHIFISGRVQGVWYRAWLAGKAGSCMGAKGWVRNLSDGRVEAHVEGPSDVVKTMIDLCYQGSPLSRVDEVVVTNVEIQNFEKFEVRETV